MTILSQAIQTRISNSSSLEHPNKTLLEMFRGVENASGINPSEQTAITLSAVYRAVKLISRSIKSQPRHLFRRDGDRREIVTDHPAIEVITGKVNDYLNADRFFETIMTHALLWGNGYALIQRDIRHRPVALHLLAPWETTVRLESGEKIFRNKGESYSDSDIIHVFGPSMDGIVGLAPIQMAARQAIGLGLAAEKYQASFYGHGLHQGGAVTLPEGMGLDDTDEEGVSIQNSLTKSLRDQYGGPGNFHKWMILEDGMKIQQLGMPLEAAQFIQSRKFQLGEIARIFDVPPHKLYDLERSTNNNIEHQDIEFHQDSAMPWANSIEQELDVKLLREDEQGILYYKFNLAGIMRADHKSRADYFSKALGSSGPAWMTQDEVRALEELNPKGADHLFSPLNQRES